MKSLWTSVAVLSLALLLGPGRAGAHCEVPCGIFDDPARFASLLEDQATIAKATDQIKELAPKATDPQSLNQAVRWIQVKEEHATSAMETIAQYFMAQRIKAPAEANAEQQAKYVDQLTKAHAVQVAAMKCKQTVDPAQAAALKAAIDAFRKSYESK
jgi:nickel superoxide dismutase